MEDLEYAGFWIRVLASIIDSVLVVLVLGPVLTMIYGEDYWMAGAAVHGLWDVLLNYVLPAVAIILFWVYRSATPGKIVLGLMIVDAKTGQKPSTSQLIGRYFAYYVSMLPFFLGFIWVGLDRRKQGWHDKLAGTVVVRKPAREKVRFESPN